MRKALDGNGPRPWNSLLWDEGELTVHVEDTLRTENLDFGVPGEEDGTLTLALSVEAQATLNVVWCEVGQHWVSEVEDDVCPVCWQRMVTNTAHAGTFVSEE